MTAYAIVLAALAFGAGSYLTALASAWAGVPGAQVMANTAGLVAVCAVLAAWTNHPTE